MTSTQAKYLRQKQTDLASEPKGLNWNFVIPYNRDSEEPVDHYRQDYLTQLNESDDSDSDEELVLWRVTPDYGELDVTVVSREADIKNGEKFSGWNNPLAWTDDGANDDGVLVQEDSEDEEEAQVSESGWITPADNGLGDEYVVNFLQTGYDESEGPTKEDNGEADPSVVYRESDIKNGEKKSGWTNPLGWADTGAADDTVLVFMTAEQQIAYDESEGPTKEDNGEADPSVVYRESDIKNGEKKSGWTNPLGWKDDGSGDDTVLLRLR
jgi:hypothetical protein